MLISPVRKNHLFVSLCLAVIAGAISLYVTPLLERNVYFLVAVPFAMLYFIFLLTNARVFMVVTLFVRALMDPLLAETKLSIGGITFGAGAILNIFIILLAGILILKNPKILGDSIYYVRWWLLFLMICTAAILYSPVPMAAFRLLWNSITYLSIFLIGWALSANEQDKKFWIKVLFLASLVPIGLANIGMVTSLGPLVLPGGRLQGTFSHPNILAFYVVFTILLSFYVLKTKTFSLSGMQKFLLYLYILDLLIILIMTQTRSAWIAVYVMCVCYGLLGERKYLFVALLGPIILMSVPLVHDRFQDLMTRTTGSISSGLNSLAWRVAVWKQSFHYIKESWFVGYGLSSFSYYSPRFFIDNSRELDAHNVFIKLLFETGILGVTSYLMIFFAMIKAFVARAFSGVRGVAIEGALMTAFITSYLVSCASDNLQAYLAYNWYFWFFLGVTLRRIIAYEKRLSDSPIV